MTDLHGGFPRGSWIAEQFAEAYEREAGEPPALAGAEGYAVEGMAMRLFLADKSALGGPWASMSDSDKRPYIAQAQDLLAFASSHLRASVAEGVEIVFRDAPQPEPGQFVEVKSFDGKRVTLGQWIRRNEGWVLSVPQLNLGRMAPTKFFLDGTWLVEDVGGCTCGSPTMYGCEPHCGMEPVANLEDLHGWETLVAAANERLVKDIGPARQERGTTNESGAPPGRWKND